MTNESERPQFTDESGLSKRESFLVQALGPRLGRWVSAFLELAQIVVIAGALVLVIRTFIVQPFNVRGASMEPNFIDHEYLIIDEISYRLRDPERGEIVVFRYPRNPREYFIKRIIGLPGELVEISGGRVRINGQVLDEPYLEFRETVGEHRVRLGADEYFLMGDNRPASLDSRIFGPVPRDLLVGRAWVRGWPISRFGFIEKTEYNF